jgi:ATP-binding cassette subfamily B protein
MEQKGRGLSLRRILRRSWRGLSVAFVAVMIEGGTDLLDPWPLKLVFDSVVGSKPAPRWFAALASSIFGNSQQALLHLCALAVLVIAVVGAVASYIEKYLTTSVGQKVMHDLRRALYHHIHRLSLSYHDHSRTGDLISRITSDISAIQDFVSSALLGVVVDLLTLGGMLAVMFYLNWRFTLIALSVAPVLFIVVYSFTHRIKAATREVRKKESEIVSVVQEALSSMRVVKAFARERYEERRLEKESLESVQIVLRARAIKARLSPAVDIIVAAGTCLVLWYGVRLVLAGSLTSGELLVFLLYLGKMYKPMRDLSKMTDTLSRAGVGFARVGEVLDAEVQVRDLPGARRAPSFKGAIEFDHVSFSYDEHCASLRDVSFKVEPGQFAAIVGPTGGGKSTLLSLIPRFYDADSGAIRIDGKDVREYKLDSLRSQVSFVLQETLLFRATIWQNIAYGKPDASRDEIIRAATLANADKFIEATAEGYDTMVGERGVTLSGGQRQRIAIARALIRNSPILILDEPTSGLDAKSEKTISEALRKLMSGRTSIVAAHRLSTITGADVIFVVKDGSAIERGTHSDLMRLGGLYAELYETQLRSGESSERFYGRHEEERSDLSNFKRGQVLAGATE